VLAGPILTVEIPVGAGRVLSLSAFDGVVLVAFIVLCRPYRPSALRGAAADLWPLALFGALAVAHSAAFLAFGHDLQLPGLARETVKYVGFAANIAMLALLFRAEPMDRAPPQGTLAFAALVIGLSSTAFTWSPVFYLGGSYVTVIGAILTVIAMLLVRMADNRDRPRDTVLTATALAAALAGAWTMWSKFFLLCIAACALIFVARAGARRIGFRVGRPWLATMVGVGALALLMAWLYTQQGWRFQTSTSVRLDLWGKAIDLVAQSFPWGIGLGQFGAWLSSIDYQAGEVEPIRFVHNQFLAFVTEAGAAGIVFALIVVKLVVDAAPAWRGVMMAVFIGVLLGALTLHDGIGLRALQLLLGYSFAVAVRPGAGGSQRHRFP
jgi:O-antigen ligase